MPPRPHYGGNTAENSPTRLSRRYPRPKALEDHISDALRYRFYTFYATIFTSSMRPLVDTMPNSPALSANVLESRRKDRPLPCSPSISTGSSPLTRGAQTQVSLAGDYGGLIPAHAGSSALANINSTITEGSSPLTRGAQFGGAFACPAGGLIPAHAGSTQQHEQPYPREWAHPRSRGEHIAAMPEFTDPPGSSPLTRGAQTFLFGLPGRRRLIPAHAGSTPQRRSPSR